MTPIYGSLLTLFALGPARGSGIYESSQILVRALLNTGVNAKAYEALIADVEELAGEGFGVEMVYWILEITEEFMRTSAPDADARESFLHGVVARIAPIYGRLTSFQRLAVARLAQELGWTLQSFDISADVPAGCINVSPGTFFAAPTGFKLEINGRGGHAELGEPQADQHREQHRVGGHLAADGDRDAAAASRAGDEADHPQDGRMERLVQA
jgi:hypothetical protein